VTRLRNFAVDLVARVPARVQTKLLLAFLLIVASLFLLGAVGLQVLSGMNARTEELIELQRKITAYRHVQHDTTRQLYGVSSALLSPDERVLDGILRQLSQFGYDLDRLEYVAQDEVELLAEVRQEYDRFIEIVTRAVQLARAGQVTEARQVQLSQATPLADRLERLTNQLVNVAEADMLERIAASERAYDISRLVVGAFALGSVLLALGLGYVFSWSIVRPLTQIAGRLRRIAAGEFGEQVAVVNRDELGALAADVNRTSEELGRLYEQIEERAHELGEALERQTATSEVLGVISRSTAELQPVLDTIAATAARLCHADRTLVCRREADGRYRLAAASDADQEFLRYVAQNPVVPGRATIVGRTALEGRTVHVPDVLEDPEFTWFESQAKGHQRTVLGVPLLRGDAVIGVITLSRNTVRPFTDKEIELVTTFADQAVIAIENVRLFDAVQARTRELTEALEQQTATSAILRVISTSPTDVQPVFETIVRDAVALCGSLFANVFRYDGELLHLVASHNVGPDYVELLRAKYPMRPDSSQVSGRAVLTRSVVRLEDALADPHYDQRFPTAMSWRRMLGVPLLRQGEPQGVIVVGWAEAGPVAKAQEELLKQFADQAVIAIENVRLFDEVQARTDELGKALEQQVATGEILRVIASSPTDIAPVLNAVAESAARLCGAVDAQIFRVEGDVLRLAASFGSIPVHFREGAIGREWVTGRAVVDRRTIHVPDLAAEPDSEYPVGLEMQRQHGHRTTLATPLLRQGKALGAILIRRLDVDPFTEDQIRLLEGFADQAVIAIENVRLFDEVQARTRELTRSVAELRALGEVSQAVNSTLELQAVLRAIAAHAVALAGADAGVFCAYDEGAQIFHIQATHELDPDVVEALTRRPVRLGEGVTGRAGLQRAAVQIADIDREPDYPFHDVVRRPGYRALLALPLVREDSLFGSLVLCRKAPGAFAAETVELVQTLANQSVLAIENAELFEEIERKGRELEAASRHKSEFLANMSHELRTPLNAVLGYAELIQDGIYGEVPEKIHAVLDRVQQNGRHLLGLINDVLDLSKIEAGQLTLSPVEYSLRELVLDVVSATEALASEKRLALEVEVAADLPHGQGDERRLTQVLLNLVSNAIKFTEAGAVTIRAKVADGSFLVAVSDTGVGIAEGDRERIFEEFQQVDSSSTRKKGGTGLGLAIARRIVELHGGRIWVESTPGQGSTFAFTLPLSVAHQEAAA
jgi:signal transduction histidine kinase/CHASE3 domain sensor protein